MKKLKLILYVAIIFAAGLFCGGLLAFRLGPLLMFSGIMPDPSVVWQEKLRTRLNLTPEQMQQIGPIIREFMMAYHNQFVRETYVTINQTNASISRLLTPEQQVKFDQFTQEQKGFITRYLGPETPKSPPGPAPGPPPPPFSTPLGLILPFVWRGRTLGSVRGTRPRARRRRSIRHGGSPAGGR